MAYCTNTDVKTYLGVSGSTDDTLLTSLIARAQKAIDTHTGRTFEAAADSTRTFDSVRDVTRQMLWLDRDLCAITSVTNGDGTAIASTKYVTEPRNDTPYYAIRLLSSGSVAWEPQADGDNENAITIVGKWAFSTTPPADIVHACIRLAAFFYRQKDAQVFDVTAQPDLGVMTVPQGMPVDVKLLLQSYVRVTR